MVLFFISTLGLSVAAMAALLALKHYELASGKVVFAGMRPAMSAFSKKTLHWGQQILPALAQELIEKAWKFVLTQTHRAVAYSAIIFERALERVLRSVREWTESTHPSQEPSAFLREVADHKKNLLYKKGLKKNVLKDPTPHDSVQDQEKPQV